MKVYATGFKAFEVHTTRTFVAPGKNQAAEPADWWDGETPRTFEVVFHYGIAEVPDPLGKWLVANGVANKSKIVHAA